MKPIINTKEAVKLLALFLLFVMGMFAFSSCSNTCSTGAVCGDSNFYGPTAQATPSPTPAATPSATPINPCSPVVGVNASGPSEVGIGEVIDFQITPVGPSGPLEGPLDYCNAARQVKPESVSTNLRQVGSASAFKQQFLAIGLGPFSVAFRVEGAVSAAQTGTVVQ